MNSSQKNIYLETKNYVLRLLEQENADIVSDYVRNNREFHAPAMPDRKLNFYTEDFQKRVLKEEHALAYEKRMLRLYIFNESEKGILGDCVYSDLKMGNVASANVGIKIDKNYAKQGIAFEVLKKFLKFGFFGLNLQRIEANILPENEASLELFKKLCFVHEGVARAYMKTGGEWRDHLRFSLIKGEEIE